MVIYWYRNSTKLIFICNNKIHVFNKKIHVHNKKYMYAMKVYIWTTKHFQQYICQPLKYTFRHISPLLASHSQSVPVFCVRYIIEIWKPAGHCDRQQTNPVGHTLNHVRQWQMTGGYFMHCMYSSSIRATYILVRYIYCWCEKICSTFFLYGCFSKLIRLR